LHNSDPETGFFKAGPKAEMAVLTELTHFLFAEEADASMVQSSYYPADTYIFVKGGAREMPAAFVLINAEIGSEDEVLKELRAIEQIKEAYVVYGVYDIVARVESETMDKLKEIVTWKVRRLNKVRSTLTMIVVEGT